MTLADYLASPAAIEDVRALLAQTPAPQAGQEYRLRFTGDGELEHYWNTVKCGAWIAIEFDDCVRCYYRLTESGYIVSDCGEAVSGIMRRTGQDWNAAMWAWERTKAENGFARLEGPALMDRNVPGSGLPRALVSVLSAVAKCAEVG